MTKSYVFVHSLTEPPVMLLCAINCHTVHDVAARLRWPHALANHSQGSSKGWCIGGCLVTGQLLATFAILLCYAHKRLPTCWAARPGFLANQNVTDQNVTAPASGCSMRILLSSFSFLYKRQWAVCVSSHSVLSAADGPKLILYQQATGLLCKS